MYQRIRDLREDNDFTQSEIAHILHCSQPNYAKYESGFLDIPTDSLIRLAAHYHTSVDYILELTNEKQPYPRK